jgi:tetratricopeptide (TPR) repeat protein
MPPPELLDRSAPDSVGQLVLENLRAETPVQRHAGPRAEEAHLRARVAESRATSDLMAEREASIELSRLLSARGRDLGFATKLARRALMIAEDPAIRTELAGWLAGLGEFALAAATLRGLCDPARPAEMARTLVKIAVLLARADDASGAVDALKEAADVDPSDATALEMLGSFASWAETSVSPEEAAIMYLEAALRRDATKEKETAFEDRLRALEMSPDNQEAAVTVALSLAAEGRHSAADEVLRVHAAVLGAIDAKDTALPPVERLYREAEVHRARLLAALDDKDASRAVEAVLDAGFEGDFEEDDAARVDDVLELAGLHELVAVRLEMRGDERTGTARSEIYQTLARLYAGPLANPDRAIEAWIEALASDPGSAAAREALREHEAVFHDPTPLIEALIRIGEGGGGTSADRLRALEELVTLAEDRSLDPALASWALDKIEEAGGSTDVIHAEKLRLMSRLRRQEDGLLAARRAYEGADSPEARIKALRRLVPFYQGQVDERAEYMSALFELVRAAPGERAFLVALERLCYRTGELQALEEILGERIRSNLPRVELVRARLGLTAIARRRGDEERALAEVLPLLSEAPGHRGAACTALVLATRLARKARVSEAPEGVDQSALLAGRARERADALVQLAGPVWPALRSILLSVAAQLYSSGGATDLGRRAAEQAYEADPSCARAVATLATIPGIGSDRVGTAVVERAMGIVVPRGATCEGLASSLEALGEGQLALVWTQRWLALCPGNREAMAELLRRACAGGDAGRIAAALSWVLSQPRPLADIAEPISDALDQLAELERSKSRALTRRALDVLGPRVAILRARLLKLAQRINDPSLTIAVLERVVASDALDGSVSKLLFDLADRRIEASDFDGAAREIARAAEGSAEPNAVLARLNILDESMRQAEVSLGSDGLIASAEARAIALSALAQSETEMAPTVADRSGRRVRFGPHERMRKGPAAGGGEDTAADSSVASRLSEGMQGAAANAMRELGSLRWDLADDRRGAEQALFRASELSPRGGVERYARDLFAFAGVDAAIEALVARANLAHGEGAHRMRADLLIEAANLANENGQMEHALVAASSAIESDPSRADAVALVERNAGVEGGLPILDHTYGLLAAAAMGRYGRRAAHYRAARQLERRGGIDLALRHAAACFEEVPGEGSSYVLLARLAERAGEAGEAVRALERVAASGPAAARTLWLTRAASLAGKTDEGIRTRLELLLQALNLRPDRATVDLVGVALRDLRSLGGEDDAAMIRFENAINASLPKLDGPDGSRAAVAMARLALEFGVNELALAALTRAMHADGDIEEFAELTASIPVLTGSDQSRAEVAAWIETVRAAALQPYSSVGVELLRLGSALAVALGDARTAASLLVQAIRRAPDDDALVNEVDVAVERLGDEDISRSLAEVLPAARRIEALLHLAEKYEREEQHDLAIAALERALASAEIRPEVHERAASRLRDLLNEVGRIEDAEAMLRAELEKAELPLESWAGAAHHLATSLGRRGKHHEAVDVLTEAAKRGAATDSVLTDLRALVRSAGDPRRHADVLTQILDVLPADDEEEFGRSSAVPSATDASRLAILRELAPITQELGDHAAAVAHYETISRLDPSDTEALEVLEREANERGDHEMIAALLARRIVGAPPGDRRRMLRLRRAAVLEQRLGKLEGAAAELGDLLSECPDDVSALRFLADIQDRLGQNLAAGALLRHLCELAPTSDEKADYGLRASAAYLAGGDLDTAEQILETVAPIAEREAVLEVRVDLARRRGDGRALSEELDRLAACSREPAERRAAILLDAARAASAIGDEAAALDRARRAAKLAPGSPDAVLSARMLEYRVGGAGTPREAQGAVDDLMRIAPRLQESHVELHAFLLAEELDVIQGGGAGMRELSRRHAEIGPLPLIALGMAERLVRGKNFEAALPLFEQALAGDLRGLRSRGRVALSAAEAAVSEADYEVAAHLLDVAAAESDTAVLAQRKHLELIAAQGEPEQAQKALEELIQQTTGVDRARAMVHLGRLLAPGDPEAATQLFAEAGPLAASDRALSAQIAETLARLQGQESGASSHGGGGPPSRPASVRPPPASVRSPASGAAPARTPSVPAPPRAPSVPPPAAAAADKPVELPESQRSAAPSSRRLSARAAQALESARAAPPAAADKPVELPESQRSAPPTSRRIVARIAAAPGSVRGVPPPLPPPAAPPKASEEPSDAASPLSLSPWSESLAIAPPLSSSAPPSSARAEPLVAPGPSGGGGLAEEESELVRELSTGSFEAGERLIALYGSRSGERTHNVLMVRRQQASIRLGDRDALRRLHEAAIHEGNAVYARALEHVLGLVDPAVSAPVVPPLAGQRLAPDLVNALLFRSIADSAVHEALAIVLETGLYRRDMGQYHLTGVARVQPGAGTILGDVFGTIGRFLGQARTALFHIRTANAPGAKIALLAPPGIVLTGDIREETPELRYLLGASITGAMPEHALVNALNEDALRTLIDALQAAFGPVANLPRGNAAVARLGQNLWQLVSPRADRRLRELCENPDVISYEAAVVGTRQAMRRAGLFAVGSLATTLRVVAFEHSITLPKAGAAGASGSGPVSTGSPDGVRSELLLVPDGLFRLCEKYPVIADLQRLATRTEFAEARWLQPAAAERRRPDPGPRSRV